MSEENTTESPQEPEESSQYEELSKSEAMSGVFTAPGETFEIIANTPKKNYWLLPMIICIVTGLIATFLFIQDAELLSKTMEKQTEKVREQLEQNVKDGKMKQEDVDKTMSMMDPKGIFLKIISFGGALVGPVLILLVLSVIYLIALKIMKADFEFVNIINVVALAMLITAVGSLLSIVLSIVRGELSSLSLGLFLTEESVGEKVNGLLTKLDVFSIWFYGVIAIGLTKIARIDMVKSTSIVFGIFIVYVLVTSLLF